MSAAGKDAPGRNSKQNRHGYDTFYSGVARGADIIFAEQVLRFKAAEKLAIRLICVIPHEGQANHWSVAWRNRYFNMLAAADEEILISRQYRRDCYHVRNRCLVDQADALLTVYDGNLRGCTGNTVSYAKERNKEVIVIDPQNLFRIVLPPRLQLI